jgi:hypothetical protein
MLFDAFWRATLYCLHPRVVVLSLLPLLIAAGGAGLLGWFFWEPALDAVREVLASWSLVAAVLGWLDAIGAGGFRSVLAPLLVVALSVPVIVLVTLLLVATMMTPALTRLVAARRFPTLERRHGAGLWQGLAVSVGCTLLALLALVATLPLWLVPPLALVLPPLIWGWLGYRCFSFEVLAEHADAAERRALMADHRWPLWGIGIATGLLGAAPSLLWAASALALVFAPLLIVVSVWLYTLVFAFSALWFAHYALAALARRRALPAAASAATAVDITPLTPLPTP